MVPVDRVEDVQECDLVFGLVSVALHTLHNLRKALGGAREGNSTVWGFDRAELRCAHWNIRFSSAGLVLGGRVGTFGEVGPNLGHWGLRRHTGSVSEFRGILVGGVFLRCLSFGVSS